MESSAKIGHKTEHVFMSVSKDIYKEIRNGVLDIKKVS